MSDEPNTLREMMIRMEGKQDIGNERLVHMGKDVSDLRAKVEGHSTAILMLTAEMKALADHGTRISNLETESHTRDGERRGVALSGKVLWAIIGIVPITLIIAVFNLFFGEH